MLLAKTGDVLEKPWKIRSGLSIATPQMVHKGWFHLFSERVKGGADVPAMCGQVLVGLLVGAAVARFSMRSAVGSFVARSEVVRVPLKAMKAAPWAPEPSMPRIYFVAGAKAIALAIPRWGIVEGEKHAQK